MVTKDLCKRSQGLMSLFVIVSCEYRHCVLRRNAQSVLYVEDGFNRWKVITVWYLSQAHLSSNAQDATIRNAVVI